MTKSRLSNKIIQTLDDTCHVWRRELRRILHDEGVVIFVIIGSTLKVDLVWNLSDLFNGIMVFPNLLALLALSGLVVAISRGKDK